MKCNPKIEDFVKSWNRLGWVCTNCNLFIPVGSELNTKEKAQEYVLDFHRSASKTKI